MPLNLMILVKAGLYILCMSITVFTFKNGVFALGENEDFNLFLDMVLRNISAAERYVIPKDNSQLLKVKSSTVNDFGTYDIIIVGAGAAGSVLANRLSEISKWKILLLEAGGQDNDFTKILGLSSYTYFSDLNWGYNTTTQKHACQGLSIGNTLRSLCESEDKSIQFLGMKDKKCGISQGKVIGGGTTINAGVYTRGHPEDFDRWTDVYENPGWSYEDVLNYFKKSENAVFEPRDKNYHGVGGYLTVDHTSDTPGLEPILVNGFKELNLDLVDYNGRHQNGISKLQFILKGNERVSAATAFLKTIIYQRNNIKISLNSFVTKILLNKKYTATGVQFIKNGKIYSARAKKEVIVSAGAINSAQLLMLSGIGPKKHLMELGIPVKKNLPVGQNLQDHVYFTGFYLRTKKIFYNQTLPELLQLYVKNLRPLTAGFNAEMVAFTNFGDSQKIRPDIEFIFYIPGLTGHQQQFFLGLNDQYSAALKINASSDIWVAVIPLHPKSRGTVSLKSKDPKEKPIINPNYFSEEEDIETLYKGIEFLVNLSKTEALKKLGADILVLDYPNCDCFEKLSKDWWKCAVRYLSSSLFHPVATNKMGPNYRTSVVDARLKVHGINGLRVADGSIIPELTSGHTMAPIIMIGEKAADLIKEEYGEL